jgi:hypothetical protein
MLNQFDLYFWDNSMTSSFSMNVEDSIKVERILNDTLNLSKTAPQMQ